MEVKSLLMVMATLTIAGCSQNVRNLIYTLYNCYERTNRRKLENTLTAGI